MGPSRFPRPAKLQVPEESNLFRVGPRSSGEAVTYPAAAAAGDCRAASRPLLLILMNPPRIQPSVIKEIGEVIRQLASRETWRSCWWSSSMTLPPGWRPLPGDAAR